MPRPTQTPSGRTKSTIDPTCSEIRTGALSPKRDFTFVTDTAEAFLGVGVADGLAYGEAYNGGTGRMVTIAETVGLIARLAGTNKPVVTESTRIRPEASEVRALLADNSKLAAATGWQPAHSLEAGLERTLAWWRERMKTGKVRTDSRYMT